MIRSLLVAYYDRRKHDASSRLHPIDVQYGIRTGGIVPGYLLRGGSSESDATLYVGSQPSIVRHALRLVTEPERATFIDVGCGKGRVLAVASEFPFLSILGIEISAAVAKVARRNIAIVRRSFPGRSPMSVVTGNAIDFPLPAGRLALFLYHPFGKETMKTLVRRLEERLETSDLAMTIVSLNPVNGEPFDASPHFVRTHALSIPYAAGEIGYGPDESDTIVVWRDRRNAGETMPDALRTLVAVKPGWRVELAADLSDE